MAKQLSPEQVSSIWEHEHLPHREIAKVVGVGLGSVSRTLSAKRPVAARKPPVAAPAPPLPASPEAIPAGAPIEVLTAWRDLAGAEGLKSQAAGDVRGFATMARLVSTLSESIRKATPEPVPDLNDQPDYVKLGAEVERRFLQLIKEACE